MLSNFSKMDQTAKASFLMSQFEHLRDQRSFSESIWMDVDKFVLGKDTSYDTPATNDKRFQNVFDDGIKSDIRKVASSYSSLVWQKKGVSVNVTPDKNIQSKDGLDWFDFVNERFSALMDDPKRRFDKILTNSINDGLNHSTMCAGTYVGPDRLPFFRNHKSRFVYFKKNEFNELETVCIRSWTQAGEIAHTYNQPGDNVPVEIQQKAQDPTQRNEVLERLQFIIKNNDPHTREREPFHSVHILVDKKHILRDSFLLYNPIDVATFSNDDEDVDSYGQSAVMDSIMNIMRQNAITGEIYQTTELNNRPAMAVYTDLLGNNQELSISAGHFNQFTGGKSRNQNRSPLEVLWSGGDPTLALAIKQDLRENILNNINFNILMQSFSAEGGVPMSATEVVKRDAIRAQAIGDPLSSIINDLLDPIVKKAFQICFDAGYFGVIEGDENYIREQIEAQQAGAEFNPTLIPEEIVKMIQERKDVYEITYLTPAVRLLQAQAVENSFNMIGYASQIGNINPNALDYYDTDEDFKEVFRLSGKASNLRSDEEVANIRKIKEEAMRERMETEQAQADANVEKTIGETNAG